MLVKGNIIKTLGKSWLHRRMINSAIIRYFEDDIKYIIIANGTYMLADFDSEEEACNYLENFVDWWGENDS